MIRAAFHAFPSVVVMMTIATLAVTPVGCGDRSLDLDDAAGSDAQGGDGDGDGEGQDDEHGDGDGDGDVDPVWSCDGPGCQGCDLTGTHLLGFKTPLGPNLPLQFIVTVDAAGDTVDFEFQPLSLDIGSFDTPREPVGDSLIYSAVPVVDGQFMLDLGSVTIPAAANPISGGDIVANISMSGRVLSNDRWAGEVSGQISAPVNADLAGSTFAVIRLEDTSTLPAFPCSDEGGTTMCWTSCGALLEYGM
ncbi:MAG: hypothetical protein ACPHRO_00585 [Nannocystaceae bacterium]